MIFAFVVAAAVAAAAAAAVAADPVAADPVAAAAADDVQMRGRQHCADGQGVPSTVHPARIRRLLSAHRRALLERQALDHRRGQYSSHISESMHTVTVHPHTSGVRAHSCIT